MTCHNLDLLVAVTMVLILATLFFMAYCFQNFGRGLLISQKSRVTTTRKPFEIDEDPIESEPSMPLDGHHGDGTSQQLMAYPALKKIQEQYHIQPTMGHHSRPSHDVGSGNEKGRNDKMEIE